MFIRYNNTNIHALGHIDEDNTKNVASGPKAIHWLRPGWNEFPSNIWAMYEKHPEIQKMLKDKKIELMTDQVKVKAGKKTTTVAVGMIDKPVNLTDFDDKRAIEIIKDCFNREILQRWLDEDNRHKVKRALEEQIKPLRPDQKAS